MDYDIAIKWLYGTQLFGIKLGLENVRRLCEVFELSTSGMRLVHVAGTNGKGSVCAIAESVARVAGHHTGLFTSPHLVSFCERIAVDGVRISEADVARGLSELREVVEHWDPHPTFFELSTILAMRHFAERGVEVAELETGMGGRLDATTAIAQWHFDKGGRGVSVITPIAMDHEEWLGSTLEEIAAEKAGIIQSGIPVVAAAQDEGAASALRAGAERAGSELTFVEAAWEEGVMGLEGAHQRRNAALAVEGLREAGISLREDLLRKGMETVRWRGRFERIDLGDGCELIVDGAHNPAAAGALVDTWGEVFGEAKATLIFGVVQLKDVAGIVRSLGRISERVILCRVNSPRSIEPSKLEAGFDQIAGGVAVVDGVEDALALARAEGARRVLVAGSLFLVGEVLALLDEATQEASSQ